MGCAGQRAYYTPTSREEERIYALLHLKRADVSHLKQLYDKVDKDGSGEISVYEFLDYFSLKRTQFAEKAFTIMDEDGSGEVDFQEFVIAIWNYCSFSQPALVTFAFDLYDNDSSGNIDVPEGQRMLREVFGKGWENDTLSMKVYSKLEALGKENGGDIEFSAFKDFAKRHPALLFPAFEMQRKMQNLIMGSRFWEKVAQQREKQARKDKEGVAGWKDVFEMLAEVRREEGGEGTGDDFTDDEIIMAKENLTKEKRKLIGTVAQRRSAKNIHVDQKKQEKRFNNRAKGIYIDQDDSPKKSKKKGILHNHDAATKKKLAVAARHGAAKKERYNGKTDNQPNHKDSHKHKDSHLHSRQKHSNKRNHKETTNSAHRRVKKHPKKRSEK